MQLTTEYFYDELNQLIRENDPVANKTTTYVYDNGGNILEKREYDYTTDETLGTPTKTTEFGYVSTQWKDLLTSYTGHEILYDAVGNPLTFGDITMTWERGRKLSTMTFADGSTTSYKYNADGIRTQKTVNGVTTDYFLEGSTIVAQKTGNDVIWYYFDGDGTRDAIEYDGDVYYYMYNPQGDVIGLFDENLNVVVEYTYDSWGKVKTTGTLKDTLGKANPFRYRGYYYDEESGFYYLNSRYYYPEIGRFINADSVISGDTSSVQGYNLFAYCFNNPVNASDGNGNWPKWTRGKFAENVSRAVSNVLAFARELLVNTFTDNAATTLSQYAKKYLHIVMPSAFMNQGLAAVRVTGEVNSLSGIPSVSAQIVRNTAKNGIPIATTIIDFGIQIANGENVLNAGVKSISHTAIGIGSAKIGMGIGTFIGGPLGTVAGGAIGLVLGTGGQIVFDIFFDKAKRS